MLSKKNKKQLKSLCNTLEHKYQLGKNEITPNFIDMLDKALLAHELIKVSALKTVTSPILQIALDISSKLHAEIVSIIGHTFCLYRENKENKKIFLK